MRDISPTIQGTVYGVLLNTVTEHAARATAFAQPPYNAAPRAPVLYIKTPNTLTAPGGCVRAPDGVDALEVNATLAIVFARTVARTDEAGALDGVAGYACAVDVCIPHEQVFRPAVRQRCCDGFLPFGPTVSPGALGDPGRLEIAVSIDGREASRFSTADLARPIPALIAEISAFMRFLPGDVLLAGLNPAPAFARPGQRVEARVGPLPSLTFTIRPAARSGSAA